MVGAIIDGVIEFVVIAVVLSRQTSARKREAMESLAEEKRLVGSYSIADLAEDEIAELGLRDIEGTEDLSSDVILKVWKDSAHVRQACDREHLRYVVADGVDPREAHVMDVHLECTSPNQSAVGDAGNDAAETEE